MSNISIIIPHYRRPALLAEAVESVRRNTNCAYEILVVDDGSPEEDWRAVQAMASFDLRVFQRCDGVKGPSRCRNIALAQAKGDYVIFLDSDDWMAPWCLDSRFAAVVRHPAADLVVFPVMLFREQPGDLELMWNSLTDRKSDLERFLRSDPPWHTSSPIWKTASLRKLGGFNEAVFYGDDSDLHMRALALGCHMIKMSKALPDLFIRRSDTPRITNSLSSSLIESRRMRLSEGTKFLASCPQYRAWLDTWQGQYLVEAEFLFFNDETSKLAIEKVLSDWRNDAPSNPWKRRLATLYLLIAYATRQHAYLVLRITRRIAMRLLPECYFPQGGQFHHAALDPHTSKQLRTLLPANLPNIDVTDK